MFKPKPPRLVTITVVTTITIVFWVFFSLYQIVTKKPESEVPPDLLREFSPHLDTATLNSVQNRLFYEEGQVAPLPGEREKVPQE